MLVLTSTSNKIIKETAAHKSGKSCFALIEGENLISEALKHQIAIDKLFVLRERADEFGEKFNLTNAYMVSENVLKVLSDTKTPQGIVALIKLEQKQVCVPAGNFLVLDNIQDPGNMGAILRSALGAGFNDVYLLEGVSITNPKVLRASMGAVFGLNLYQISATKLESMLKQANLKVFACDMNGQDVFKFVPPPQKFGMVVGNEGNGISDKLRSLCSGTVSVSMQGGLESLNAAVAASIVMFSVANKN